MAAPILVDEHVPRVVITTLESNGFHVERATEQFGEETVDCHLLQWCNENDHLFLTNDKKDFNRIANAAPHSGVFIYADETGHVTTPEKSFGSSGRCFGCTTVTTSRDT